MTSLKYNLSIHKWDISSCYSLIATLSHVSVITEDLKATMFPLVFCGSEIIVITKDVVKL